jgi:hypothetical protein
MDAWLDELRPYAGEPRGSAGWRLAKSSWRLVRGQRTILQLVLMLAALWTAQGYWFATAGLRWQDGDVALILLIYAVQVLVGTFLLGALAACVDATLDGIPLGLSAAREEMRERLRPLLSWAALSLAIWIGLVLIGRGLQVPATASVGLLIWYVAGFFAIPLVVLGEMGPLSALRESLRVLLGRKRQSFVALIGIWFFGALAMIPGTVLLTHVAALHWESGRVSRILLALGLLAIAAGLGLIVATKEAFAVMIVRDEIDDLSPREYAGKRLRRRVKFLRFCGGVAIVIAVFGITSAITKHDRAVVKEANSPGTTYTTELAYGGDLPSGSAVVYRGRKIGEVLGSEQDGSSLQVRFHVEPGFGPTSTPGELTVEATGGTPCLVIVPAGETPPGNPRF